MAYLGTLHSTAYKTSQSPEEPTVQVCVSICRGQLVQGVPITGNGSITEIYGYFTPCSSRCCQPVNLHKACISRSVASPSNEYGWIVD